MSDLRALILSNPDYRWHADNPHLGAAGSGCWWCQHWGDICDALRASPAPETRTADTCSGCGKSIGGPRFCLSCLERVDVTIGATETRAAGPRCPTCGLFMRVLTDDHRWAVCDACRAAHFTDARAPETRTGEGAKTEPRRTVAGDGWHRPSRACGSPLLHYDRAPDRCHCRCERCSPDARAPSPREGTP